MTHITQAIEGSDLGMIRDGTRRQLIKPTYEPISPDYVPDSPDYAPDSPDQESSPSNEFRKYDVKNIDTPSSLPESTDSISLQAAERNAFTEEQIQQMWKDDKEKSATDDTPTPEMGYERDLGSADKKEEADNILKTVSSLNDDKINKDLNLLTPMKEDDKSEVEKEDDSSKIKKIN